jgi:hypothetical protein
VSGEIKNPADRAHMWDRPTPAHEREPEPIDPNFPRHVHKQGGQFLEVVDQAALDLALLDGWSLTPIVAPATED